MPNTEYSIFQITELTAKCSIIILEVGDYFVIKGAVLVLPPELCNEKKIQKFPSSRKA